MPPELTTPQRAAVEHREGPLLVLAGPGSGKTRVITRRIARLIETGVPPYRILALTFTNKAAGEMNERVADLVPGARVWISTFHRFCSRLLRDRAESVGLTSNFSIFDTGDQQSLMRQVLRQLEFDPSTYTPQKLLGRIGRLKNEMVTAEQFAQNAADRPGDHFQSVLEKAYPAYQKALLEANAVDFDDLLLHVAGMMKENEEWRAGLDERYSYCLVDEYQDTNLAQYAIVRGLSLDQPNLCVTGDPDQSIYGWRGARIKNILDFERDYPTAEVVRLEENFRSTGHILRVADELIVGNVHRKAKKLITQADDGQQPRRMLLANAKTEAEEIAAEIAERVKSGERSGDDFAIFYRVNSLSRQLEQAFRREGLAYQIASGVSFYDRMEVKDLLSYLRVLHNPADVVAFQRIVNTPKRSIGQTTQRRLLDFASEQGLTPIEAIRHREKITTLKKAPQRALGKFLTLYDSLLEQATGSMDRLLTKVINESQYTAAWEADRQEEDAQRLANVEELINAAAQYDRRMKKEGSLEGFLEEISLASEVDDVEAETGRVTLMTLHAAKGLEFPCVYIVGLEHGLLPHARSVDSHDIHAIEEERRLLFVGITRAREELTLTHVSQREIRGRPMPAIPSEFLQEVALEAVSPSFTAATASSRSGWSREFQREYLDEEDFSQEVPDEEPVEQVETPITEPKKSPPRLPSGQLMTAAGLLNGESEPVAVPTGFGVGDTVRHPRYGPGRVVAADGLARNRRVTVLFEDDESRRTFIASKSPLQPIG